THMKSAVNLFFFVTLSRLQPRERLQHNYWSSKSLSSAGKSPHSSDLYIQAGEANRRGQEGVRPGQHSQAGLQRESGGAFASRLAGARNGSAGDQFLS